MSTFNWDYHEVPDHTKESLENYFVRGFHPGGFLSAVLANDLLGAVTRADHINKEHIADITKWICFNAPYGSHGSYEAVDSWCRGNEYRTQFEKRHLIKILSKDY